MWDVTNEMSAREGEVPSVTSEAAVRPKPAASGGTQPPPPSDRGASQASKVSGWAILTLLTALLVDVLFEGWIQQMFGHWSVGAGAKAEWVIADWPKDLKSALFILVLLAALVKVAIDRSWRDFLTKAELALAILGVVMVIAGLLGGSDAKLIGEALFVYFRGVIVFFAWRALKPSWKQLKPVVIIVLVIAVVNAAIATVETVVGYPSYPWFGWTDLTWARISRAHALLNHPNHLGHFLMVVTLGMVAWFSTLERVPKKMWWLFGFLAFGLSAAQSRESAVGFVAGVLVIWWIRRTPVRPLAIAAAVMIALIGLQTVVTPENRATITKRVLGVFAALGVPSGSEDEEEGVPQREIRVLFYQQGLTLWMQSPLLGYGIGQFGGTVAFQSDPNWNDTLTDDKVNPKDPDFNLHGAKPDQVDSFWLHLTVETGILGLAAYLAWMFFLARPLIQFRVRGPWLGKRRPRGPPPAYSPAVLWAAAVLGASLLIAFMSPSLEDQLYPTLMFTAIGLGWVALRRGDQPGMAPVAGWLTGPAKRDPAVPTNPNPADAESSDPESARAVPTRTVTEESAPAQETGEHSPRRDGE